MTKFRPGFFTPKAAPAVNEFEYVGVVKFLEVAAGFTAIDHFGNTTEYLQVCNTPQNRQEYGVHDTLFNALGGGLSNGPYLFFQENTFKASFSASGNCWQDAFGVSEVRSGAGGTALFNSQYLNNQWIGMEFILDIGTPGNTDGSVEIYLYDENGNQTGHNVKTNYNKLVNFDHYYNKVVIGGNRFGEGYQQDAGDSNENRFYVEDFIIHGSRIGPTYFNIVKKPKQPPDEKMRRP